MPDTLKATTHCPKCNAGFAITPISPSSYPAFSRTAFEGQQATCPSCKTQFVIKVDGVRGQNPLWTDIVKRVDVAMAAAIPKPSAIPDFINVSADPIIKPAKTIFGWAYQKAKGIKPTPIPEPPPRVGPPDPLSFEAWYNEQKWYGKAPPIVQMALWASGGFAVLPAEYGLWLAEKKGKISRETRLAITGAAIVGTFGAAHVMHKHNAMQEQANLIGKAVKDA